MTLEQENAELKAHINSLRGALVDIVDPSVHYDVVIGLALRALATTPTQSLAEHDKQVIAEFREKCERIAWYKPNGYWHNGFILEDAKSLKHINTDEYSIPLFTIPPIDNEDK